MFCTGGDAGVQSSGSTSTPANSVGARTTPSQKEFGQCSTIGSGMQVCYLDVTASGSGVFASFFVEQSGNSERIVKVVASTSSNTCALQFAPTFAALNVGSVTPLSGNVDSVSCTIISFHHSSA
eukprot:CAMPEP_0204526864 /NCGR_PEP_ID=MMETSP0661-20131031/8669_1 /ASSEMBLY_ACC=CAM_ASM_000606 /TAXON_ID=109239 /ORGANISM="Alexandrium margalefi, Strain AMGDE01CS-322" /LENGTH=123 /DNA_ID=CAMNT_0051532729 /DNA_START=62 /DNA_END=436 /DNA_ORIENTATION=-